MSRYVETPYRLCWSTEQYEDFGGELGFGFETADFRRASSEDRILGVRRYIPASDAPIELGFPPGVLVRCFLLPKVGTDTPGLDMPANELLSLVEDGSEDTSDQIVTYPDLPETACSKAG